MSWAAFQPHIWLCGEMKWCQRSSPAPCSLTLTCWQCVWRMSSSTGGSFNWHGGRYSHPTLGGLGYLPLSRALRKWPQQAPNLWPLNWKTGPRVIPSGQILPVDSCNYAFLQWSCTCYSFFFFSLFFFSLLSWWTNHLPSSLTKRQKTDLRMLAKARFLWWHSMCQTAAPWFGTIGSYNWFKRKKWYFYQTGRAVYSRIFTTA